MVVTVGGGVVVAVGAATALCSAITCCRAGEFTKVGFEDDWLPHE